MSGERYNPVTKWFSGIMLPLIITAYAGSVLIAGRAAIRGRYNGVLELTGIDAILYAASLVSLAAAVHFFQFWGNSERLYNYSRLGAGIGLLVFALSLGVLVARQFLNFV